MWRQEFFIALFLCFMAWGQSLTTTSNRQRKEKSSLYLEIAEHLIKTSKEMIADCAESVANTSECITKVKLSASLDMAQKMISEARQNYPTSESVTNTSECTTKVKVSASLDMAQNLISEARENYPTCIDNEERNITEPAVLLTTETTEPTTEQPIWYPNPKDCSEVFLNGQRERGVHTIWLDSSSLMNRTLEVFCDKGGWTVIQRRGNFTPQEDFFRDWKDYKEGFGRITKDFWIGNDNLFGITSKSTYKVKFNLEDVDGNKAHALYDTFWIEDETAKYRLHIDGYSGNAGDAMKFINNRYFSTKDRDNDNYRGEDCAGDRLRSGWWQRDCSECNPNGPYQPGVASFRSMYWFHWRQNVGLAATEIKIKRKHQ